MNINKLERDIKEARDKKYKCIDIIKFMEEHGTKPELLDEVVTLRNSFTKQVDKLSKQLSDIRENCEHDWRYTGSGSHDDFYKCRKCGEFKTE